MNFIARLSWSLRLQIFFKDDIIQQRLKNSLNQWLIESFRYVAVNEAYYQQLKNNKKLGRHVRGGHSFLVDHARYSRD